MSVRVCTCTCVYTCVHVWVSKVGSRIWMATLRAFLSRLSIGPPPAHPLFSILFSCAVWVCHFFGFVQHSLEIRATATLSSKHCIIASRFASMSFNTGEAKGMRQAQTSIHKGCGALVFFFRTCVRIADMSRVHACGLCIWFAGAVWCRGEAMLMTACCCMSWRLFFTPCNMGERNRPRCPPSGSTVNSKQRMVSVWKAPIFGWRQVMCMCARVCVRK